MTRFPLDRHLFQVARSSMQRLANVSQYCHLISPGGLFPIVTLGVSVQTYPKPVY